MIIDIVTRKEDDMFIVMYTVQTIRVVLVINEKTTSGAPMMIRYTTFANETELPLPPDIVMLK